MTEVERNIRKQKLEAGLKELGDAATSPPIYLALERRRYLKEYYEGKMRLDDVIEEVQVLLKDREDYIRHLGRSAPPKRSGQAYVELTLGKGDHEHAEALSLHLAKQALLWPEVRRFRERVLGGSPLPADEPEPVRAFLQSEIDSEYDLPRIDPVYHPGQLTDVQNLRDLVAGDVDPDESVVYPYRLPDYPLPGGDAVDLLRAAANYRYPYEAGAMEFIRDHEGGSLGDLGRRLATTYPWDPGDAAWFVLTGEAPKVEPVRLFHDEARGTFTLTFMPWVSKMIMLQVRRVAQQRSDSGELKEKALEVFRFVTEHANAQGSKAWDKLRAEWNKRHPDQRFANRSSIASAYQRAEKKLAGSWASMIEAHAAGDDSLWPDF